MKLRTPLLALSALIILFHSTACGQTPADDEARKAQILANLQQHIPQLRQYEVTMGSLTSTDIEGLDEGSFTIAGQQVQKFLVSRDNTSLYFIGAQVLDVSRTSEELAVLRAEEEKAADEEAVRRHALLRESISGLPVRGNPDAPVTIVEFSDFQCPYCARSYWTVHELLKKYPDELKLVYLHFPLGNHPWAEPAAIAAICTAQQDADAFWTLHDRFFENQSQVSTSNVLQMSEEFLADTGIDMDAWSACAGEPSSEAYQGAAAALQSMMQTGQQFGLTGTPGFFINGYFVSGAQPLETFEEALDRARTAAQ